MSGRPQWSIRDLLVGIDKEVYDKEFEEPPRGTVPLQGTDGTEQATTWDEPSVYVKVPERAINRILELEPHLFTEEERAFIKGIGAFEYHPRFTLFRLNRRKTGKWHRLTSLTKRPGYVSEVGEHGLLDAFEKLSAAPKPAPQSIELDKNGNEIIDLSMDSDDEDAIPPTPSPDPPAADEVRLDYYCKSAEDLEISDGLHILNAPEVKSLCDTLKIKCAKMTKDEMISALIKCAAGQTVLSFPSGSKSKGKGKGKSSKLRQTTLSFARPQVGKKQTGLLKNLMLKALGNTIMVNPHLYTLMRRLSIIWHRSTEYPEQLFHPALMAGFNKQVYATYDHVRHPDIWETREQYVEYEKGLQIEAIIDELLKPEPKNASASKTPAPVVPERLLTPATPGLDFLRCLTRARTPSVQPDGAALDDDEDTCSQRNARYIKRILEAHALAKWEHLVEAESQRETPRKSALERLEAGYVYTRIIRKCSAALATLKEFDGEKKLLDQLLQQRFWRRGSRGNWYDRRALIQMTYLFKNEGIKDMNVIRDARTGLQEALADDDTATISRPALIRRLERVEKMLKLKTEERTQFDDLALQKADEVEFTAVRVWEHPDALRLDSSGRVKGKENKTAAGSSIARYLVGSKVEKPDVAEPKKWKWTGKSLWQGNEQTINVEERALEYYAERGFKGFHSETQILTTLFGLLFWDIIFAPVLGAFETPWQRGPLDLMDDSFYYARKDLIEARLAAIKAGEGHSILEGNDNRYRADSTCCIGVNWEMCSRDDLLEIVECMGGDVLSSICRLFCEDYRGRSSGVPDLIIWHPDTKECKFVEVKGPGDTLQENQKLWSDALLTAKCAVEICHVRDSKAKPKVKKEKKAPKPRAPRASTSKARKGKAKAASVKPESEVEEEEDEEEEVQPMVVDDEEAWMPSTVMKPVPPRDQKRRRRVVDEDDEDEDGDDQLPVFTSQPTSSHHPPPAIARKRRSDSPSVPSKKRRTTI